ncbi:LPP20 family lipoprotein [Sulfurimonas sp. SAG-AH-194-C21]|nr:LPP20 family lipoprotein [Sulfurimonas sp. SAG-AH-194-C21]MDF1882921.1 LPP20 family lipoprotein [Sulfurimonas sp. SAG-AH-194-C21]
MKYIFLGLVTVIFILGGCSSKKVQVVVEKTTLPSWYTNPPLSNATELYALGEGKDKKEALAEALSFMASTLSVSISSNYNARTEVREGRVNSSDGVYKSDITSKVQEVRISSYEVLNAKSLGFNRYAVLIKSNKTKLFKSMVYELDQKFSYIQSRQAALKGANALDKLFFYKIQNKILQSIPTTLTVMNVLNPSFEGDEYIRKTQKIGMVYQDIVQNISFSIKSNKLGTNLKAPLAKAISAKRLKIKESQNSQHFSIYISNSIEKAQAYGFWLARSEITIKTKDYRGVIVGSNTFQIIGQSSQSFAIAKQNVAFKLSALIQEEGISKVLGIAI